MDILEYRTPCENNGNTMTTPNQKLLDEINQASLWRPARKTKCLWGKVVQQTQTVTTLEGELTAKEGEYLCRGVNGEIWPQNAETLLAKYEAISEFDNQGWQKFCPRSDAAGVMAAQLRHPFTVSTNRGALAGQPNDYLVKHAADERVEYPDDVWPVAQDVFELTYEFLNSE